MTLYRGFSSFEYEAAKTFVVTDIELVKLDLLNHIFTRRGERLMMPMFGTVIPDIIFEPIDDSTIEVIRADLITVVEYDPRVSLIEINVLPDYDNNTIVASMSLLYIELEVVDQLDFNIEFKI